jgi:hypothetical protein
MNKKIKFYIKLVKWYPACSSPAIGMSKKLMAPEDNICSEFPVGISYKGTAKYHT